MQLDQQFEHYITIQNLIEGEHLISGGAEDAFKGPQPVAHYEGNLYQGDWHFGKSWEARVALSLANDLGQGEAMQADAKFLPGIYCRRPDLLKDKAVPFRNQTGIYRKIDKADLPELVRVRLEGIA